MRRALLLVTALSSFMADAAALQAQVEPADGWKSSFHVAVGTSLVHTDWTISHPVTSGFIRQMETINGIGNRPSMGDFGLELRRRHIAFQANLGWMSSRLTLTDVPNNLTGNEYEIGRTWDFSTYQVEGAVVYLPWAHQAGVDPFVSVGAGYLIARGDTKMTGGSLSLGVGIRLPLSGRVEASAGATGQYLRLSGFDLLPPLMTPTIALKPVAATVGLAFKL